MTKPPRRWRTTAAVQQRAKELRRQQTPAEARLWQHLRGKQLNGLKFRRQHPVGPFVLDFYCAAAELVVELDGDTHAVRREYDQARTEWLEERGYRVIRFTNSQVHDHLPSVLEAIAEACEQSPPSIPPRETGGRPSSPPSIPPVGRGGSQTSPPQAKRGGGD